MREREMPHLRKTNEKLSEEPLDRIFEALKEDKVRRRERTPREIVLLLTRFIDKSSPIQSATKEETRAEMMRAHLVGIGVSASDAKWFSEECITHCAHLRDIVRSKATKLLHERAGWVIKNELQRNILKVLELHGNEGITFADLVTRIRNLCGYSSHNDAQRAVGGEFEGMIKMGLINPHVSDEKKRYALAKDFKI